MKLKLGYVILIAGLAGYAGYRYAPKPIDFKQASFHSSLLTVQEQGYRDYFAAHGSPIPATLAKAVNQTSKPAVLASIAKRESNGNHRAKGDSGKSKGAFQVQERHWGKVRMDDPYHQALQADRVLSDLEREVGVEKSIERYNGKGKKAKAYAKAVKRDAIKLGMGGV